jgi:hypothetical protein
MEQVMDAVVDADVDGAIPKLSQPSQLSSVSLEANEAPVLLVTGMRYAVVIAECECCTNHFLFAARVNTHRNIFLAKENTAIRGQLLVQKTLQEEACDRLAVKEKEILALQISNDRHACTTRTAKKKKRDLMTEATLLATARTTSLRQQLVPLRQLMSVPML